jgi:AraC family transcriptional regulator, exoenzyme S synthesis regulatory protein ExsA
MKIYNLPNDFSTVAENNSPVIIRAYQSQHNTQKHKSVLHQNMVDIVLSGQRIFTDVQDTKVLAAGEFMILSKGNCLISEVLPGDGLFSNVVIYFTDQVFANFLIKYQNKVKNIKVKGGNKKSYVTCKQDHFISNFIQSLQVMLQSPSRISTELRCLKMEELLLYLLDTNPSMLLSLSIGGDSDEDMQVRMVAENNIASDVTVEELAFLCNTSLSSFKRKFARIYGTSPQKWFLDKKMQLAGNLLKESRDSPGSVYSKVGYKSHASFTQAFKQQYGITPKEYQDRNMDF